MTDKPAPFYTLQVPASRGERDRWRRAAARCRVKACVWACGVLTRARPLPSPVGVGRGRLSSHLVCVRLTAQELSLVRWRAAEWNLPVATWARRCLMKES